MLSEIALVAALLVVVAGLVVLAAFVIRGSTQVHAALSEAQKHIQLMHEAHKSDHLHMVKTDATIETLRRHGLAPFTMIDSVEKDIAAVMRQLGCSEKEAVAYISDRIDRSDQ